MLKDTKEPSGAHLESLIQAPLQPAEPEALFSVAEIRTLQLASHECRTNVSDFLAHEVARDPAQLRCHVQRISLFLSKGDGEGVYGALVDLFIALGEKGPALRHRMLDLARSLLSEEQYRALSDKLHGGLSPLDRIPLSNESILGKGIQGTTRLVERVGMHDRSSQDLLQEAHSCLEYGQVDEARRLLEEAVLLYPLRADLHRELLEIYIHSRDYANFSAMLQAVRFTGNPVPPAWEKLAAQLGLNAGGDEPADAGHQRQQSE